MISILPTEVVICIFKFLDYKDIFKVLEVNKKLNFQKGFKKNYIWRRFFFENYLQNSTLSINNEYFYYNLLKKLYYKNSYYTCFTCNQPINTGYIFVLCDNCEKALPNSIEKNFKYHANCLEIKKKCKYSKVNYFKCNLCNSSAVALSCNIYS
ncbi:hypothetical protein CPAV1605_1066 [seawater metagenome]|uniref:F-box domain-containing protein n=1 Tax=seawater metagenome TaxID=1561972 RepID=A0A5E8CLU1_9ZZZZ